MRYTIQICLASLSLMLFLTYITRPSIPQTTHYFTTPNYYDFSHSSNPITTYGDFLPPPYCQTNKCPLFVFLHGSLNWREHHNKYIELLHRYNISVFKLYPFDSRNVSTTKGNQTQVTHQQMISDAYSGVKYLTSTYPNLIDTNKLAICGTSIGGGTALYSAWNPTLLKQLYNTTYEFALHIALYPPCFVYPTEESNIWTNNTVIIMIGTDDQWTKASACTKLISRIYNSTQHEVVNKKLYLYNNEHHSFDAYNKLTPLNDTYDFSNCEYTIALDGTTYYDEGSQSIPLNTPSNRKLTFDLCANKQNIVTGYNSHILNKYAMNNFEIELISALRPELLY